MKIKTENLVGKQLDWAVAKALGEIPPDGKFFWRKYSTDWAHGGPIIEREQIGLHLLRDGNWQADLGGPLNHREFGYSQLIAAMRCYVASKLGDEVEVPE